MIMKQKFLVYSIIAVSLLATACSSGEAKMDSNKKAEVTSSQTWTMEGSNLVYYSEPDPLEENELRIHYKRKNSDYDNYTVWAWNDTSWGGSQWPKGIEKLGETEYGAYYDIPLKENAGNLGFLMVDKTNGEDGKDGGDKSFTKLSKYNEIYIKEADETVYVGTDNETPDGIESAALLSNTEILLSFTDTSNVKVEDISLKNKYGLSFEIDEMIVKNEKEIILKSNLREVDYPYSVAHEGFSIKLNPGIAYYDGLHAYKGNDLGAVFNTDGTISIKLWSPTAVEAYAVIFDEKNPDIELETINMTKGERGTWSLELSSEYKGKYYQYKLKHTSLQEIHKTLIF